jgi:DNA-directed RNA polymerase specialized sigma24 family protein
MPLSSTKTAEFIALYDEMADQLFRHCYFKVSNRELALDLVQETFARTWEYIASAKK